MNIPAGTVSLGAAALLIAMPGFMTVTMAAEQMKIDLGGQFCEFYADEVKDSLMEVSGVTAVDAEDKRKWVVVEHDGAMPADMIKAINKLQGDGWRCMAEFASQ